MVATGLVLVAVATFLYITVYLFKMNGTILGQGLGKELGCPTEPPLVLTDARG